MLLGLIYISDAGFARLLNGALAAPLGLGNWAELYLGSDLLMLGLGVYDLATRKRLHPVVVNWNGSELTIEEPERGLR
jgi:hypothetical protein